jgi:hypothetical protein
MTEPLWGSQHPTQRQRGKLAVGKLRERSDLQEAGRVALAKLWPSHVPDAVRCWALGATVSVVHATYPDWGHVLIVTHPRRDLTLAELLGARHALIPDDVLMVLTLPGDDFTPNVHPRSVLMWQIQGSAVRSNPPGRVLPVPDKRPSRFL